MRKNIDPFGIYNLAYKTGINADTGIPEIRETITIEGRTIFDTDDKKLIEIFRNDPEIVEVNKNTQIEADEEK